MRIRQQLLYRSSVIFAITLSIVAIGTYLLFRYHTHNLYTKKLMERAKLAAYFYLEKDELNEKAYRTLENQFKKISRESIRLYHAHDKTLYVKDTLNYHISVQRLNQTIKRGTLNFSIEDRQIATLYYKDNQGDFIIVASGIDTAGQAHLMALAQLLAVFCIAGLVIHYFLTKKLANSTFNPFSNLIEKVNQIKPNDLSIRLDVPEGKPDEMKNLIVTFNYFLERLDKSVTIQRNFLKNASHELRTPIAILLGEIELALNQPRTNDEYKTFLEGIKSDSLQLKAIVEGLLTLSNLEIATKHQMQPFRIDEVLWSVLEKKQFEYKDVKIAVDLKPSENLEACLIVIGNRDLLAIALGNIIDNAVKFSIPAPVSIMADASAGHLKLSISDKGPGINEEDLQRIFELFYRSTQHTQVRGYGIGLYLTQQILNLHQIKLNIFTKTGEGTRMEIVFP